MLDLLFRFCKLAAQRRIMFNEYEEFLTKKAYKIENVGFDTDDVHPMLFPFSKL